MFVLNVTYVAPIEAVEPHVEPHMKWVAQGYERGTRVPAASSSPREIAKTSKPIWQQTPSLPAVSPNMR